MVWNSSIDVAFIIAVALKRSLPKMLLLSLIIIFKKIVATFIRNCRVALKKLINGFSFSVRLDIIDI